MAKIRRDEVIVAALDMLNEAGLEGLTTRRLASRLGVESPALYWHFRDKAALLDEMAAHVMLTHRKLSIPDDINAWALWFAQNAREFRQALLAFRDGARLHAGSKPDARELKRIAPKIAFLVRAGIPRREALMALLAAGRFTLGCVLEEQASVEEMHSSSKDANTPSRGRDDCDLATNVSKISKSHVEAFEFGINLIIDGIHKRIETTVQRERTPKSSLVKRGT